MGSIFGVISSETPRHTVITKAASYEIRRYLHQIRAEVEVEHEGQMMSSLNQPFRLLAGYIFGGNTARGYEQASEKVAMTAPVLMSKEQQQQQQQQQSEKVAMTAPVLMQGKATKMKMSFIMPSKYASTDSLPIPKDAKVHLVEVPEHKVAVITFSGSLTDDSFKVKEQKLREAAGADGVKLSTDPNAVLYAAYNPPWCLPWLKTNEVMVPVLE